MENNYSDLIIEINDADHLSNENFIQIINKAVLILDRDDISHRFDMSKPALDRWLAGRNLPHPVIRQHVYNGIISLIKEKYVIE